MKSYDVIILGAGASGLMCASHLRKDLSVAIIDANSSVGQKLKVSGGGKCNITNISVETKHFDGDEKFISNVLDDYSNGELLAFLKENSVTPILRKNQYYFCPKSSNEIIDILKKLIATHKLMLNAKVISVAKKDDLFEITTDKTILKTKKVVIATGGKSFVNLGASDIGLNIAKSFNLKTTEFFPALVGLTLQKEQFWMKELSGLSCQVRIKAEDRVIDEEMLFAHRGISGPAILSASLYWKKGTISIDFLPDKDILTIVHNSKKLLSTAIPLPKRLSLAILKAIGLDDMECKKLSKEKKDMLANIHNYNFAPAGNFGFTKAEVSRGGVMSKELDNHTLETNNIKGLYFVGEVVDITGQLGGYNFQWAFSSGFLCAKGINSSTLSIKQKN